MKIEIEVYDIPKDKDGFFEDTNDDMFKSLPILVFCEDKIEPCICDLDNWGDWLSDFNKERYKHYIKVNEIKLPKQGRRHA